MIKVDSKVSGGNKARAYFKALEGRMKSAPRRAEVGFLTPDMAGLAAQLEYGNPATSLPERPAFRNGVDDIRKQGKRDAKKAAGKDGVVSRTGAARLAAKQKEIIQANYHEFHGAALSERQIERKGHDQPLVGHEGPRLINRIEARVDGQEVD